MGVAAVLAGTGSVVGLLQVDTTDDLLQVGFLLMIFVSVFAVCGALAAEDRRRLLVTRAVVEAELAVAELELMAQALIRPDEVAAQSAARMLWRRRMLDHLLSHHRDLEQRYEYGWEAALVVLGEIADEEAPRDVTIAERRAEAALSVLISEGAYELASPFVARLARTGSTSLFSDEFGVNEDDDESAVVFRREDYE